MKAINFGENSQALIIGNQKINLHEYKYEFEPKAKQPTPGSADLCFITNTPLEIAIAHLHSHKIEIIEGPVTRTGALGSIVSIYFCAPDCHLI